MQRPDGPARIGPNGPARLRAGSGQNFLELGPARVRPARAAFEIQILNFEFQNLSYKKSKLYAKHCLVSNQKFSNEITQEKIK